MNEYKIKEEKGPVRVVSWNILYWQNIDESTEASLRLVTFSHVMKIWNADRKTVKKIE